MGFVVSIDGFLYGAVHEQKAFSLVVGKAKFVADHAGATVHEFGVGELHVHHLVAFHAADENHHGGGDHVANHLLARAGFHSRRACDIFRPDNHLDGDVGGF